MQRISIKTVNVCGIIVFSRRSIWVLLGRVGRWTQHFSKIDHKTHKIGQICIWNPMTTTDLHHQYGISSLRNVPSGEERGETDVFAGYWGASKVHYGRCASGGWVPVFLVYRPQLFKRWIALSTGYITIQWISIRETNCAIQWIVIYPVDFEQLGPGG